jgi:SseB protein N-terminal domain/SseB protein C-terminal domain
MTILTDDSTAGEHAQEAVERALAAAITDSSRIGDLLDELSRGRLWLPLPDDGRPVTDGSAVTLPTVTYLGSEFVPAFTSAARLRGSVPRPRDPGQAAGPGVLVVPPAAEAVGHGGHARVPVVPAARAPGTRATGNSEPAFVVPHIVVPAAALARRLPPDVGIALNPGAGASVPVYPEGVAYLAAAQHADPGSRIRVGPLPVQPDVLLGAIRAGMAGVPAARDATAAWLSVESAGEGLVISVTLDDPNDAAAQEAALRTVERAALTAPQDPWFPIHVTFAGEGEPDPVDQWVSAYATPFYRR